MRAAAAEESATAGQDERKRGRDDDGGRDQPWQRPARRCGSLRRGPPAARSRVSPFSALCCASGAAIPRLDLIGHSIFR